MLGPATDGVTRRHRRLPLPHRVPDDTIRSVSRHLEHAGFVEVELRTWDLPRMYEPYLPHGLAWLRGAWSQAAYRLHEPGLMGHLAFKAVLRG